MDFDDAAVFKSRHQRPPWKLSEREISPRPFVPAGIFFHRCCMLYFICYLGLHRSAVLKFHSIPILQFSSISLMLCAINQLHLFLHQWCERKGLGTREDVCFSLSNGNPDFTITIVQSIVLGFIFNKRRSPYLYLLALVLHTPSDLEPTGISLFDFIWHVIKKTQRVMHLHTWLLKTTPHQLPSNHRGQHRHPFLSLTLLLP